MADTFWLSFRLSDKKGWRDTYNDRLTSLNDEIREASGDGPNLWVETTSFFLFASDESTETIVARIKSAIALEADIAVLGKTEYKTGRVIGKCDDMDIFNLVPWMKKV